MATAELGTIHLTAVAEGEGRAGLGELTLLPFAPWRLRKNSWETHSGRWHSLFRLQPWNVPQGQEMLWLFPLYTGRQRGANREKTQEYYALKPSSSWGLRQPEAAGAKSIRRTGGIFLSYVSLHLAS